MQATIIRWPAQAGERDALARAGLPRLLIVAPNAPRPTSGDPLEDWIAEPVDDAELNVRASLLARRYALSSPRPQLEGDVLRIGERGTRVTAREQAMLRVLIAATGAPVNRRALNDAYIGAGGDPGPDAFRTALSRLRKRLVAVGAELHVLHSRAVMLEVH